MKEIFIAPSILSANFSFLDEELKKVKEAGATYLHFDVMDGHFVPNLSFGPHVLKTINLDKLLINDVHLMVEDPRSFFDSFIDAGANIITFHYEVFQNDTSKMLDAIEYLHSKGVKAGVSIKPNTSVTNILDILKDIDLVLIMSVEPGFGGQKFMPIALDKIKRLSKLKKEFNYSYLIEVDGGINKETAKLCRDAGVDILVAGSFIFNNEDYHKQIKELLED